MATYLERLERLEAKMAIEALNVDFCYYLDHNLVEELVDLFTEDARYSHGPRLSCGRAEIRALFARRASGGTRTSRHLQTGLKITLSTARQASGTSVCLTFACDGHPPISPATPFLIADFIDDYLLCADGRWRIHKRDIVRIFTASDNKGPVGLSEAH